MPRIRCFVIWEPRWTASMSWRILARTVRAAPEPSFALGPSPHRSNRRKVKSTRAFRVCQVVAVWWDVAVCARPCVLRNAGRRLSPDAGVVRWLAVVHSAPTWPRFAAGVDIVLGGGRAGRWRLQVLSRDRALQ